MVHYTLLGFPGGSELLIILAIVVLLFGAKRIPELAKGLGEGIRNFRTGMKGDDEGPDHNDRITDGSDKS
jgi:sec-independent protein translocase protein TatA